MLSVLFLLLKVLHQHQIAAGFVLSQKILQDGRWEEGQQSQAEEGYLAETRELGTREEVKPSDSVDLISIKKLNEQGLAFQVKGQFRQAEQLYRRALAIQENTLRPDHPDLAETLKNYAELLRKTRRKSEVRAMDVRAKYILAKNPPAL